MNEYTNLSWVAKKYSDWIVIVAFEVEIAVIWYWPVEIEKGVIDIE